MTSGTTLAFNDSLDSSHFSSLITAVYSEIRTSAKKESIALLDTFDGRLFRAGYIMRFSSGVIYIKSISGDTNLHRVSWSKKTFPESAEDFTNSSISLFLKPILGVRKLQPRLQLKTHNQSFNLLNEDRKIVIRGTFISTCLEEENEEPGKSFFILKPLRGYLEDSKNLISRMPAFEEFRNLETALLGSYNVDLKDRSKPVFEFTAQMHASEALQSILQQSFKVMRENEAGILDDTDMEFLHDYRVAGRRMRSALSQIKGILEDQKNAQLQAELKFIGNISGPLRDLDVYLLREEEYVSLLPDSWRGEEIHNIFATLKLNRQDAYKDMCSMLQSGQYRQIVARWENFFKNFSVHVINNPPILELARDLIQKQYKKVISQGKKLSIKSTDEDFHKLRILCKKLRYLMEFFSSLFNTEIISGAVKQLKKIQDNLGNFNDLSVQIDTLSSLRRDDETGSDFIQTVSGLIAVLNFKKQQLRNEFISLFKEFVIAESELFRHI